VPGDARCAARLGRYKRAECSCTVGDGCRKEIEPRRSRSRSRWRWIGDGDRAADGSTSRACLERVGWGARLLAVQPAEGRSETNSTTTVYTPQGCRTRPVRDTSTWLYCVQACFFASLRYDLRRRAFSGSVRAPCHRAVPHSPLSTLVTARIRAKVGIGQPARLVWREAEERCVGNPVTVFRSASGAPFKISTRSPHDLHMIFLSLPLPSSP